MLPKVVMKFGGTSMGNADAIRRTMAHIAREKPAPLVVVSAVGGVTDLLLDAAQSACKGEYNETIMEEILQRHRQILAQLDLQPSLLDGLNQELTRLLQGVSMLGELSPRVRDNLVSLGERMSARVLAAALEAAGHPARAWDSWDLGLCTNEQHGCAEPVTDCCATIRASLDFLDTDVIPVVTGFIARSEKGEITTLGRGGSDFSAALFGAAAQADEIQIWTDVPGILRADPRAVPQAQVIRAMHFEEAAELAFFGAKVLHPRTIEPARQLGIPVRVLGTFHVDPLDSTPVSEQGTLIDDSAPSEPVRGMAIHLDVQTLHVHSLRMLDAPGFLSRVFEILSRHQISVDVIATSEVSVSMTLDRYEDDLAGAMEEISEFAEVEQIPNRSLLCLVGSGLRKDTSLLARIFQILAHSQVPVRVISQGASRINITLVTDPPFARKATQALYGELFGS